MRPYPTNPSQELRHFSTIEVDKTPLTDVFCVRSSFTAIKRSYKKLAPFLHPDRVARIYPRGSAKCMSVLSRALELAKIEAEYDEITSGGKRKEDFLIPTYVLFTREITRNEEFVQHHEAKEKRKEGLMARQQAPSKHDRLRLRALGNHLQTILESASVNIARGNKSRIETLSRKMKRKKKKPALQLSSALRAQLTKRLSEQQNGSWSVKRLHEHEPK